MIEGGINRFAHMIKLGKATEFVLSQGGARRSLSHSLFAHLISLDRALQDCARKKPSFQEKTRFQGKWGTKNRFSNRI